ncbi:MAG TPA: hypothetical protein VJ302_34415 [Blastocatellia bacterium]|nr:hypothetical protein [Blastocatellia bacterium]
MSRSLLLFSILVALAPSIARAAEPAAPSVESAGYQRVAAPGTLMSVFGTGFPTELSINRTASEFPLPSVLDGVWVLVNNFYLAPLLYVGVNREGNFQINYQLRWEAADSASIEVFYKGTQISSERVMVSSAAPGLFTINATGTGQVVAQNYSVVPEGFSPNSNSNPVPQGGILVLYGTGTGGIIDQETRRPATPELGEAVPATPLYVTPTLPSVTIGGKQARVLFSGLAPGYAGLWQINIQLDPETPVGEAVPIVINYGGQSTRAGITVAVRRVTSQSAQ